MPVDTGAVESGTDGENEVEVSTSQLLWVASVKVLDSERRGELSLMRDILVL